MDYGLLSMSFIGETDFILIVYCFQTFTVYILFCIRVHPCWGKYLYEVRQT